MKTISEKEVIQRIKLENPWWGEQASIDDYFRRMKPRAYLERLYALITGEPRRAVVLMGPRRVGKTVLLHHVIQNLINKGTDPKRICYISIEAPVYIDRSLDELLRHYMGIFNHDKLDGCYIIFDEIQYLRNWEVHLKKLVDDFRTVRFIVSGSAAAALKLKSMESGAGRFTDFHLPPLTFFEYLDLLRLDYLIDETPDDDFCSTSDINRLNSEFINYLNFGGYPEALFSEPIKADPGRYIKSDIIDKVLLRDLPILYGIQDVQELNRLFTVLAYNTGDEISLDELSHKAGVAKNTIKKYLEYLEAAFLIQIIHRVDQSGKRFKRANYFKVYLTNPSMRCALFGPISFDDESMGYMAETAIISQWLHSTSMKDLYYARWKKGEVDLVHLTGNKVHWCAEIKWSDRFFDRPEELKNLIEFSQKQGLEKVIVTTVTKRGDRAVGGVTMEFVEASAYSYTIGRNTIRSSRVKNSPSSTT